MHRDVSLESAGRSQNLYFSVLSSNWMMFFTLMLFMGAAWYILEDYLKGRGEERFDHSVQEITETIHIRMVSYEQLLRGGVGLMLASPNVTANDWKTYAENSQLSKFYEGIHSFGYIELVADTSSPVYQQDPIPQGNQLNSPSQQQSNFHCVVKFIDSTETLLQQSEGFDMCSEQKYRQVIFTAIDNGNATMTGEKLLEDGTEHGAQSGFLMYFPVYRQPVDDVSARWLQAIGLVYVVIRIDDLMQGVLASQHSGLRLALYASDLADAKSLMFSSSQVLPSAQDSFYQSKTEMIAGQVLRIDISSDASFVSNDEENKRFLLQFIGCSFMLVLMYSVLTIASKRQQESIINNELMANEDRFKLVIESSPSALLMVDDQGLITQANSQTVQLFGYSKAELIGQPIHIFLPQSLKAVHQKHMSNYLSQPFAKSMSMRDELFGFCKDGTRLSIEVGLTPIHMSEGVFILATIHDVSERKRIEAQRILHTEELERINQELDRFTYIASHDLKSPLRGIEQLTSWLSEDLADNTNENVQKYLGLIQSRIQRMVLLLDGLLMFSRIGRVQTEIVQIDSRLLVEDMFALVAPSQGFSLQLEGDFPHFSTFKTLLELVIRNLISNAIKHHDRGEGVIKVTCERQEDRLWFSVIDDGPGISDEFHSKVFEMFQTLRPRDEVEGSGLGLSLVKKTVESLKGEVQLVSKGRGCCFRFSWPIEIKGKEAA
ncbi:CHASE domain-containing protein [Shewanella acanthi]|uniref:CHASE domain-containing protein n=1 Tax=Shewanella acanthi TaxID=2864212 RepID=UPI001C65A269|nr:CHASE domain-containing protein [Shewanella acanthi]QYJ79248.1 CHASE domain-containing protein [Shewanella acanthi]